MRSFTLLPYFLVLMAMAPFASAYIGPGSGISVIGSLLGLLVTIFLAVGAILFWPLRRMLKKKRMQQEAANGLDEVAADRDTQEGRPVEASEADGENTT